ncbi:MAG: MlaA family lipoprotein [Candidatus Methylopumilus sp.]
MRSKFLTFITICLITLMTGCTTVENKDPLEGINRGVYKFNDVSDKALFKPIAGAYKAVMPTPVQSGVNNFFANLKTFVTSINQVLQFKFNKAAESAGRFVINSTIGIAGLFDVASRQGIPQYKEDFGQTLGYWGVGNGAYLMLPILGPSTLRDTVGLVTETYTVDPLMYIDDVAVRNSLVATKFIDARAQLLPGSDLLDEAALDPYAFMRDAYLQRRANQVSDGTASNNNDGFEPDNSSPSK